jgi:putative ABC transport system ATP-binding protein
MNPNQERPILTLRNVEKIYPTSNGGFTALHEINADFFAGEFVGILGKSGAGKSTLVNMITGTDQLTSGEVIIKNSSIHRMDENQAAIWRGQNLGIIYQGFRLMPSLSLLDNVRFPIDLCGDYDRELSIERAMQLLKDVELGVHALKPPTDISGGQQQRVAIARALANDPPIIVADEPTGRLDSNTTLVIVDIFEKLARQGKLVVMATHDSSIYDRFSRRLFIADGEISEDSGRKTA